MSRAGSWLAKLRSLLVPDGSGGLRDQLLRGSAGSFMIKGIQTFLTLGLMVLLARLLGAEGYGVYAYVLALVEILGIPAQAGLQALTVREVAAYREKEQWPRLKGVLRFGFLVILVLGVLTAVVVWSLSGFFADDWSREKVFTLGWGVILLPLMALSNFRGAALRGLKKIGRGLLPENVLRPGGMLLLCGGVWLLSTDIVLTPSRAMLFHAVAAGGAFLAGSLMLMRALPQRAKAVSAEYETRAWLSSLAPLSLITGMQLINSRADIVMLGILGTSVDVGVYRIAAQGGVLVVFGLKAINMVVGPHFSSLWAAGDRERLQRVVTAAASGALMVALPVVLVFMVAGDTILGLVFGEEFATGHLALAIIAVGQLINAAAGSVVLLLNMTGQETVVVRGLVIAATSNILLNLVLIPIWGMEGAAVATVVTFGLWNLGLWWSTHRRMGIDTMALGAGRFASALVTRDDG